MFSKYKEKIFRLEIFSLRSLIGNEFSTDKCCGSRSWRSCGLRRGFAAARLPGLRFQIPPGAEMSFF